ncbi:MAG: hypothetical protein ACPGQ5_09520 [Alphaproteobacteria bacterium]
MSRPFAILPLLAILLLAACMPAGPVRDLEGRRIGAPGWEPITGAQARLSITGTQARIIAREKMELPGRYLERWWLEGGHLVYESLTIGGFGPDSTSPNYLYRLYGSDPSLARQGVRLRPEDIRVRSDMTFVVGHSPRVTCFAFVSVFGSAPLPDSPGNRLLRGGICRPVGDRGTDSPDVIALLESLRVEGIPLLGD